MRRVRILLAFVAGAFLRRLEAGRAAALQIDLDIEKNQHRDAKQLLAVSEADRAVLQTQIDGLALSIASWEAREQARARIHAMKAQPNRHDDNLSERFAS